MPGVLEVLDPSKIDGEFSCRYINPHNNKKRHFYMSFFLDIFSLNIIFYIFI